MSGQVYFEDVQVGQTHRFGRYEVTREEIVEYLRVEWVTEEEFLRFVSMMRIEEGDSR